MRYKNDYDAYIIGDETTPPYVTRFREWKIMCRLILCYSCALVGRCGRIKLLESWPIDNLWN